MCILMVRVVVPYSSNISPQAAQHEKLQISSNNLDLNSAQRPPLVGKLCLIEQFHGLLNQSGAGL